MVPLLSSAVLFAATLALAQARMRDPARPRPAVPPLARSDQNSPKNAGRLQLYRYLDGMTILGMRRDDAIRAIDVLAAEPNVDPDNITAVASGQIGLVVLHAPRPGVTFNDPLPGTANLAWLAPAEKP